MGTTSTITWTLGDRLAKARRHANVSTESMAAALGVSRKTINNYESDRTPVRVGVIRVWADVCGVPFEWLVMASDQDEQSLRCFSEYAQSTLAHVA